MASRKKVSRRFRTLIRVTTPGRPSIGICLPGWDSSKEIIVSRDTFPKGIGWQMRKNYRFHGFVEVDEKDPEKLVLSGPYEAGHARRPKPIRTTTGSDHD